MRKAFTLIELLIVVALNAVLAAIAVPNLSEAQVRSKVSRSKTDLRSIAAGLEAYRIDHDAFMKGNTESWALSYGSSAPGMRPVLESLTTPIAYISNSAIYIDSFEGKRTYFGANLTSEDNVRSIVEVGGVSPEGYINRVYGYTARNANDTAVHGQANDTATAVWFLLESCGPDGYYHRMGNALNYEPSPARYEILSKALYDPTNGTISRGSIWRSGGGSGRGAYFKDMVAATN